MITARASAARLEPFASGAYVTCSVTTAPPAGVRRADPPATLARPTALKGAVDLANVFHLDRNIPPSRAGTAT